MIRSMEMVCRCGKKFVVKGYWYNQYVIECLLRLKICIHKHKEHGKRKLLIKNIIFFIISLLIQIMLIPFEFIKYFY